MRLITFEDASSVRFGVAGVRLLAPIPEPAGDVIAVGRNYREHAQEFTESGFDASEKAVIPPYPVISTKARSSGSARARRSCPPATRPRRQTVKVSSAS
jgi:2-keto-4-pentenoate hydratase/2-oxohepta-3-ene-1,7-dioic acid hydratase in catechol pathway